MTKTLIIQSHRIPLPQPWLEACTESVRLWAEAQGHVYRFMDDALFDPLEQELIEKFRQRPVILSDLARLLQIRSGLNEGFDAVAWLDADFYIFAPEHFELPPTAYAVGRENWIQRNAEGRIKNYRKVHNAALLFRRDNAFLDFYIESAQKLLRQSTHTVPNQFIGPKLLSALHNICQFPVMEQAGMLSPLVQDELLQGGGEALDLFREVSDPALAGVNLCASQNAEKKTTGEDMLRLMQALVKGAVGAARRRQN